MSKPNLFQIATKELSQDGFFTWLLQWADPDNAQYNQDLHNVGQDFVRLLLGKKDDFKITKVKAGRQWENIDIWAEVNDDLLIIIEDKTNTGTHSNQLSRYRDIAQEWCDENKRHLVCVYLKTGSESKSSLKHISDVEKYTTIDRTKLLLLFEKSVQNDIYSEFVESLKAIDISINSYETEKINDWKYGSWQGFYQFLDEELDVDGWNYVANPSGGFLALWWHILQWENCNVYLQIEGNKIEGNKQFGRLCFKIGRIGKDRNYGEMRNKWHSVLIEQAKKEGKTEIQKPKRFGNGEWMTVAVVERENWLGADDNIIDKNKVIERLKEYEQFLNRCVNV